MTLGVKENPEGTKTKEEEQAKVASEAAVEIPKEVSKVSPKEEPLIYSQKQADDLVHAARSDAGRQVKDIETERDKLKSQIQTKTSELETTQTERESLEARLEDLTKDDPERTTLVKMDKELRGRERELKTKLSSLDDRETKLGDREKKVNAFELEVLIETIADEYEDGDSAKLKNAISGFENPTEEQIRNVAGIVWKKKAEEEEGKKTKGPKHYSGESEGGSPYFTREQISDRKFWTEHKEEIQKAQAEGRIRD